MKRIRLQMGICGTCRAMRIPGGSLVTMGRDKPPGVRATSATRA